MNWSTDLLPQRPFQLALVLALVAHGALVLSATGRRVAAPAPARIAPLQVRQVPPGLPQPSATVANAAGGLSAPTVARKTDQRARGPGAGPKDNAAPTTSTTAVAGAAGEPEYLPRNSLSVPPRPRTDVVVPFPEIDGVVDLRVKLALFIDAAGTVRRVRLDTPDVPPVFAQTIQDAFRAARFTPGEVDSVPVASQIRIEVDFGSRQGR